MAITHTQFCNEFQGALEEAGFEGLTKADVKAIVEKFGNTVTESLAEQLEENLTRPKRSRTKPDPMGVTIKGLGRFVIKDRPARTGRNPATGEAIDIAPSKQIRTGPDMALLHRLNEISEEVGGKQATPIKRRA
jgi:DNA-binding protein HU-beta